MPVGQDFLLALQNNPQSRQAFDSQPDEMKRTMLSTAWEDSIRPQIAAHESDPDVLRSARETWIDRYLGAHSKGPIMASPVEKSGLTTKEPIKLPDIHTAEGGKISGNAMGNVASSFAEAGKNITSLVGLVPNRLSEGLGNIAESYKAGVDPNYAKENPVSNFVSSQVGPIAASSGLEAMPLVSKLGALGKTAIGAIPFSSTPKEELVNTAVPYGLFKGIGYVWNKFFGSELATTVKQSISQSAARASGTPPIESIRDAENKAILKKIGVDVGPQDNLDQVIRDLSGNPDKLKQYSEAQNALEAEKLASQKAASDAAKAQQSADKEGLRASKLADKRIAQFTGKFGRSPSEDELIGLKASPEETKKVFEAATQKLEDEALIKKELATNQGKLVQERLKVLRRTQGALSEADLIKTRQDVSQLGIDDVKNELNSIQAQRDASRLAKEGKKKSVTDVVAETPQEPTITEKINSAPDIPSDRPDVSNVVNAFQGSEPGIVAKVVAPPAMDKFDIQVAGKPITLLTKEEAQSPGSVDTAIKRFREAIAQVPPLERGAQAKKHQGLWNALNENGMESRLQQEGLSVLNDVPKAGRRTLEQVAQKPPEVVKAEANARKAEKERSAIKEGQVALADKINAMRSDKNVEAEFVRQFKRKPGHDIMGNPVPELASEQFHLDVGRSPGEAVDGEYQIDLENQHPHLFPSGPEPTPPGTALKIGFGVAGVAGAYQTIKNSSDISDNAKTAGLGLLTLAMAAKSPQLLESLTNNNATKKMALKTAVDFFNSIDPKISRKLLNNSTGDPLHRALRDTLEHAYENIPPVRDLMIAARAYIHGESFGREIVKNSNKILLQEAIDTVGLHYHFKETLNIIGRKRHNINPGLIPEYAKTLIDAVRGSTTEQANLYRGLSSFGGTESDRNILKALRETKPGDTLILDRLQSFADDATTARNFSGSDIILKTIGPIKRFNVAALNHFDEQEALTFGTFKIVGVKHRTYDDITKVIKSNEDFLNNYVTDGDSKIKHIPSRSEITIQQVTTEVPSDIRSGYFKGSNVINHDAQMQTFPDTGLARDTGVVFNTYQMRDFNDWMSKNKITKGKR